MRTRHSLCKCIIETVRIEFDRLYQIGDIVKNDLSTLVLITNQYPYATGDSSFIVNEVEKLSENFSRCLVFTWEHSRGNDQLSMPDNFELAGHLSLRGSWYSLSKAITPALVAGGVRTFFRQARSAGFRNLTREIMFSFTAADAAQQVQKCLHTRGIDVEDCCVYSFWGTDGGLAIAGFSKTPGRTLVRFHRYDLYEEIRGYLPLRGALGSCADILAPISESGVRYLSEHPQMGKYRRKVHLARLGTVDRGVGRGSNDSTVRVVSCSAISPVKRVDLILEVLKNFARRVESDGHLVEWLHMGDGPLANELNVLTQDLPANLKVSYAGQTEHNEVLDHYAKEPVDVFINLSSSEGVPVSIMEAMSFNIPVLATDVGGTSEIVSEEQGSGILVGADAAVEEISVSLERLVNEKKEYDPRKVWEEYSDTSVVTEHLVSLLLGS